MTLGTATRPTRVSRVLTAQRDSSGTVLLVGALVWTAVVAASVWTAVTLPSSATGIWAIAVFVALWLVVACALLAGIPLLRGMRARSVALAAPDGSDPAIAAGARAAR